MSRKILLWTVAFLVVLGAGAGYLYYQRGGQTPQATAEPALQTAVVRRGNLVVSASGTGRVIPAVEIALGFEKSGRIQEIFVQVGDQVKSGDKLASLVSAESSDSLALAVSNAELEVLQAQQALDELYEQAAKNLAQAQVDLISAQEELNDLIEERRQMDLQIRCSEDTINDYRRTYNAAYKMFRQNPNSVTQLAVDTALAQLNWCNAAYTAAEIAEMDAQVALAQAKVDELQRTVERLQNGPDPTEVALAEAQLANAKAQLKLAQEEMETQYLVAPMDGIILEVDAQVGSIVGTSAIITLASLTPPTLEVYVDETDLNSVAVGYEVEVVFDALPDQTFRGRVVRVDPSLSTVDNVSAVRAIVALDESSFAKPQVLPVGLQASVEVIQSQAENVLLVPVESLRKIAEGKYAVMVIENGVPKLRQVEVGLMDLTYAEILSGLSEGEVVSTGTVETGE
jgi:multidrug efflux pump subunit AcrA (membrane-fusion protein)